MKTNINSLPKKSFPGFFSWKSEKRGFRFSSFFNHYLFLKNGGASMYRSSRPLIGGKGFTLIEILVAMAIASIVATMVLTSFTTVMSAGEYITSRAELSHTTRFIIRSLSEDIASASPLPNNPEGFFLGNNVSDEERQADEVFFTGFGRRFVLPGAGSDQALISWFVVKTPDRGKFILMRGENPNIFDVSIKKEKASAIDVTDQLVSFDLRYLVGSEWKDSFNPESKKSAPKAVRVDFILADEHGNVSRGQALMPVGGKS